MRVIALGFFDGVHIGHGALLRRTRERATELGLRAAAMSFDSHPDTLVSGVPVPLINSMDDRAALMRRLYGIDDVIFAHFDRAMMEMPWEDFLGDFLVRQHGAAHLVCGHDFLSRTGHAGAAAGILRGAWIGLRRDSRGAAGRADRQLHLHSDAPY